MPSSVCQLDNIETTGRFSLPQSYQEFSTSFNRPEWLAVRETYQLMDLSGSTRRSDSLDSCRQIAWFVRNTETGKVRVSSNHCHLRWCPLCATAKKAHVASQLQPWLRTANYPKMVTLTLQHSNAPLSFQVNSLYQAFRKLRKTKLIQSKVTGGIWFFQIKFDVASHQWHPHIHSLMTGKYIPHGLLSTLWLKITHTSFIVDIRPVNDFEKASFEVSRYCARPSPVRDIPKSKRTELFSAMHGRRLCGCWGSARAISLNVPRSDDTGKWERLCRWETLRSHLPFNEDARLIYKAWSTDSVLASDVTLIDADNFIDNVSPDLEPEPPPVYLWKE